MKSIWERNNSFMPKKSPASINRKLTAQWGEKICKMKKKREGVN